jgi:hypothetical protein
MSFARLSLAFALALAVPAGASAAERLTDEQVRLLIDDIDDAYKTWKQDLERRNLDDAIITSAERTVKVKDFLKDFDKAIETFEGRFKNDYAASLEALTLLRRGSDVELRNRRQNLTPGSAWTVLAAKLTALAIAYGVEWPVESMNVLAARLNDGELAAKVEQMESAAKQLQKDVDKAAKADKAIDKATRESLKSSIQQLQQKSKDVRERIKDDRPASVEVGQLLADAAKLDAQLSKLSLATAAAPAWKAIESGNDALVRAFELKRP